MILDRFLNPKDRIIFSIGYEKRTWEEFLTLLKTYKIKRIVDVRLNPISENPNFSQGKLRFLLKQNGIKYVHFPQFAPPIGIRRKYQNEKNFEGFAREFNFILSLKLPQVEKWASELLDCDCLLCYEKKDSECHRSLLYPHIPYKIYPISD